MSDELGGGGPVCLERDLLVLREEERLHAALDRSAGDENLANVRARGNLVHHIEEYLHDLLETFEGAAAHEKDVRCVDLNEVLVRVLPAALRRDVRDGPLEDLEERLLDALTGDVASDRRVVALPRDLVDLVDVDDAALRAVEIEVGGLDEPEEDVLDILADVSRLREAGRIGDRERYIEDPRERLGEERLATPGRSDEEDVRLPKLDVVDPVPGANTLVVVVDGDRKHALRLVLSDDILVEDFVDAPRARDLGAEGPRLRRLHELFVDDLAAEGDALVADVDALPRDELADLILALAAEGAAVGLTALRGGCHDLAGRHRLSSWLARVFLGLGDRDERLLADEDLVDETVLPSLLSAHEPITLGVALHLVLRLPGMVGEDLHELVDESLELFHLDQHVGGVAAEAAHPLVDHDARVRERVPLAFRAGGEQDGAHRGRLADANRVHRCLEVLHRVVDGESGGDDPTR